MNRFIRLALVAFFSMNTVGVLASEKSPEIGDCINDVKNQKFNDYECNSADDAECLCANTQYFNDVSGCAADKAGATPEEVRQELIANTHFCEVFAGLVPGASQSPSQTPQTSDSAANTPSPTPEQSPEPTPTPSPETTTTPAPTPTSSDVSSEIAMDSTALAPTTTSTDAPSGTTETASSETSSAASPDAAASGLSQAAMAGIGVGVAVAVIAAAVIAFCLLKRRKRSVPRQSMDISKPLPGSGRTYPTHDHERDSFDKYANDIEMTSNRYEDMSTGQQPRTMV